MKSLSTGQDALARRAHLVPINLVKITDYAESTTWYLSDRAVSYDYEGTGAVEFFPWVKRFGRLSRGMSHLPDSASGALEQEWGLVLSNETWEGERLAETLDSEILEGATVEWAQILMDASPSTYPVDLSDWASTDKTVHFNGYVKRVGPITEGAIELSCIDSLPQLEWIYVTSADASLLARGARIPLPYGDLGILPATAWDVGSRTVLSADHSNSVTTIYVVDTTGFAESGTARMEAELITYGGKTATTLTGCVRGVESTSAVAHSAGISISDVSSPDTYIVAENSPNALNGVYALSPSSATVKVLLTVTTHYTATLADTTTVPGKTVASFTISGVQGANIYTYTGGPVTGQEVEQFYGDIEGPSAPYVYNYSVLDDCESATGWTRGILDNSEYAVGSGSIRFEPDIGAAGPGTSATHEDYTDWTLSGSGWTLENNTSEYTSGSNSVRLARDDSGDANNASIYCAWGGFQNLTNKAVRFNLWVGTAVASNYVDISVTFLSGDVNWRIEYGDLSTRQGQWTTIVCEIDDAFSDTTGGDYTQAILFYLNAYTGGSTEYVDYSVDDVEYIDIPLTTQTAYKTFSSEDWSSADGLNFQRRVEDMVPDSIEFWASSDTPSGNTPPANRREITVPVTPLDTWAEIESQGSDVGSPNHAAIISFGLTVTKDAGVGMGASDVWFYEYPADVPSIVWLDHLREGAQQASRYKVASGTLLEHPADIFRHFVEEVAGETVDETSVVAAETNLGSNKLAFDARSMGLTWAEIASRIGYESRANVVKRSASGGSQWAFLAASTTYTFTAPTLTVSQWEPNGIALAGRGIEQDLFTRFVFYYLFNPSIGYASEAFTAMLRVSPSDNDISAKVATADITTAEAAYGSHEAAPMEFLAIQDSATAIDTAGYYVHEIIRRAKLFAIRGVPWYDGEAYALELGDTRNVTPPWSSTAVKCRVIEIIKDETEQLELRLVEVE